jgi:hypothetical protein
MSAATAATDKISYRDLYERWEAGNWSAAKLDFTQDHHDWWHVFSEQDRRAAIWNYSLFQYGEDSVADNLSPYIDAAPHAEQQYFLTTQQVDEARHAVFFARFMAEVAERGHDVESTLAATAPVLTWGFKKTFDRLEPAAGEGDRALPHRHRGDARHARSAFHRGVPCPAEDHARLLRGHAKRREG